MFPMPIAQALGIEADLVEDDGGGTGVEGTAFSTWSYAPGLLGQIVRVPPDNPSAPGPWGPSFPMTPSFSTLDPFLLGRQDFFARWSVLFQPGDPGVFVVMP
jgi:hypothetical protein